MTYPYMIRRRHDKSIEATSIIPLGERRLHLHVTTARSMSGGLLFTRADVNTHHEDGGGWSHVLFQDYSKVIAQVKQRGTEAAIKSLHVRSLNEALPAAMVDVRKRYGLPDNAGCPRAVATA